MGQVFTALVVGLYILGIFGIGFLVKEVMPDLPLEEILGEETIGRKGAWMRLLNLNMLGFPACAFLGGFVGVLLLGIMVRYLSRLQTLLDYNYALGLGQVILKIFVACGGLVTVLLGLGSGWWEVDWNDPLVAVFFLVIRAFLVCFVWFFYAVGLLVGFLAPFFVGGGCANALVEAIGWRDN